MEDFFTILCRRNTLKLILSSFISYGLTENSAIKFSEIITNTIYKFFFSVFLSVHKLSKFSQQETLCYGTVKASMINDAATKLKFSI